MIRIADRFEVERMMQRVKWSEKHDDSHSSGELALEAACLAANETEGRITAFVYDLDTGDDEERKDMWGLVEKHKADRIRQLEIAGALLIAEIERLEGGGTFERKRMEKLTDEELRQIENYQGPPELVKHAVAAIRYLQEREEPTLTKNQPCGCVVCTCQSDEQC